MLRSSPARRAVHYRGFALQLLCVARWRLSAYWHLEIEWLKGLVDALNADHFEADAAAAIDDAELRQMSKYGSQIAQVTFLIQPSLSKSFSIKRKGRIAGFAPDDSLGFSISQATFR